MRRICPCLVLALLGALAMLGGAFIDVDHPAFRLGLVAFLVGATGYISRRTGVSAAVLEQAQQRGYELGYREGRQVAHPVVVPINRERVPVESTPLVEPRPGRRVEAR